MRAFVALVLVAGVGCGRDDGAKSVVLQDSAGIRIVESLAPSAPGSIVVDTVPVFDIGGEAGGAETEFISPIASAIRLADGRIVASGWAMTNFKVFDSRGRWLATVGRVGGGPGEFQGLGWIYRGLVDTIVTFEPGHQRLQLFDASGKFVRLTTPKMPANQANPTVEAIFHDGTMLVSTRMPDSATSTDRTFRNRVALNRLVPATERYDSLLGYLSRPVIRHPQNGWSMGGLLFEPGRSFAAGGSRIALTTGDRFEVAVFDLTGTLVLVIRRRVDPVSVTDEERETAAREHVTWVDSTIRDRLRSDLLAASTSGIRPPIDEIRFATDGKLWVRYGERRLNDSPPMAVFDTTGRWETDVEIPKGITINEIGADYLLGSLKDDDGFYHIRLYRIRRALSQ